MTVLSAEELLAGAGLTRTVSVPDHLLAPPGQTGDDDGASGRHRDGRSEPGGADRPATVVLRPLLLADIVRLHRAAGSDDQLASALMVQQALVDPTLTVDQVHRLPAGLVEHLLAEIHQLSGLTMTADDLASMVHDPLAKACVVLAREFGWTPEACAELTVGQILLYLEMIGRGERP